MGGVVSAESGRQILGAWNGMKQRGGVPLLEMETKAGFASLLTPGLIDMTDVSEKEDKEWFGPLLQIYRVQSLQAAIDEANDTKYGLSAGLLSQSADDWNEFVGQIRAGVVNLNRQTTGASGKLPFGGCGFSGNHRPSGYFAADYCSFPIASMETDLLTLPEQKMVGIRWD
jgi:succinylglutamic semialdehyde dehydrogenase